MKTQFKSGLMLTAMMVAMLFLASCAKDDMTPGSVLDGNNFNNGDTGSGYTSQLHNVEFQRQGLLDSIKTSGNISQKTSDPQLLEASELK